MNNNRIILEGCIQGFKKTNELSLPDNEVFEIFSLTQIHKDRNITYENIISSIVDGGNDGGIDSIMVFVNEEFIENVDDINNFDFTKKPKTKFIISQCKKENSFKEGAIDKLITSMPILLDLERNETALLARFNSKLVEQALLLIETWKKTSINGGTISLEYIYVSNAPEIEISSVFEEKKEQLSILTKKSLSTSDVSFNLYSSNELLEYYQKQKSNRLSIEFKEKPLSIDFEDSGIGYVGPVRLGKYKEFLQSETGDIRDDLFESNIRHFQGLVDVNKQIKTTIENPSHEDFWWLNNGITIIAEEPKEVGKKLSIENVQIVNGLQTSYSIFNNHDGRDNDQRSVLVKVIINTNKDTIDNIIASTNRQNPVSPTLLRATEKIQRNLEIFFFQKGYYYDRRKNYYKNQGKPATKIFSIQSTAQSIYSVIYNEPHLARSIPTSLLKNDESYKKIFNENNDFEGILNCCLISKKIHDFFLQLADSTIKNKIANFKLHLTCLLVKKFFDKKNTSFEDLSNFNTSLINIELFNNSVDFLVSKIDSYLEDNPESNLINIAKSKNFTEYLLIDFQ